MPCWQADAAQLMHCFSKSPTVLVSVCVMLVGSVGGLMCQSFMVEVHGEYAWELLKAIAADANSASYAHHGLLWAASLQTCVCSVLAEEGVLALLLATILHSKASVDVHYCTLK